MSVPDVGAPLHQRRPPAKHNESLRCASSSLGTSALHCCRPATKAREGGEHGMAERQDMLTSAGTRGQELPYRNFSSSIRRDFCGSRCLPPRRRGDPLRRRLKNDAMRPCATLMVATLERSPSTKVLQVTSADCTTRRAVMIRTCDGDSDAGLRKETWTVAMASLMVATLGRTRRRCCRAERWWWRPWDARVDEGG